MFDLDNLDITTDENADRFYKEAAARAEGIEAQLATIWNKFRGDDSIRAVLDNVQEHMDKLRAAIVCGQNALNNPKGVHVLEPYVAGFIGQADELEADLQSLLSSE
jgi:hypothetical protein